MAFFSDLRSRQSSFYRRLWDELDGIMVFDTHEHTSPEVDLWQTPQGEPRDLIPAWAIFDGAYIHGFDPRASYDQWATVIRRQMGTGYVKSILWALEDLFGVQPPVTPKMLQEFEEKLNEAYDRDAATKNPRIHHIFDERMHVATVVTDIKPVGSHQNLPQPSFQGAVGLPSICNAIRVPSRGPPSADFKVDPGVVPYWFAQTHLNMDLANIQTLDDYLTIIDKLIDWIADQRNPKFLCTKFQLAYERPIAFPEPNDDDSKVRALFNKPYLSEQELWLFGDFIMHYYLERISLRWNRPLQFHTGLARMFDGGSNALNLSHLLQKFPDMKFDMFHGNYPWHMVLAGMLHQIPNVHADLCWLPIISPTAAQQLLTQCIEVGNMTSVQEGNEPSYRTNVFGGDCRVAEGSYGALQMAKDVTVKTLEDLYDRGLILLQDAVDIAERLLYGNPKRLFGSTPS